METEIAQVSKLVESFIDFGVKYGFQILGALVFLFVGLKVAGWIGTQVQRLAEAREIDVTLAKFFGNVVKLVLVAFVAIATLGNFGIQIAPLIALAGAAAFGATFAIQGPLSNFGAGLSLILTRPFAVGNTITVNKVSGVVEEIKLGATILTGEDGERITIPNKDIVGHTIVNSDTYRIVESQVVIATDTDAERAVFAIDRAIAGFPEVVEAGTPQVGVHGFSLGGIVIGMRFWAPSRKYYQTRYAVHLAALKALIAAGVRFLPPPTAAAVMSESGQPLTSDGTPL